MNKVILVATGGTIASRYNPASGDVIVANHANDLAAGLSQTVKDVVVQVVDLMNINSYQMGLPDALLIVQAVQQALADSSVVGVVVTHGTDTLEETSFLADLLMTGDAPVVFTGAQRSADDPHTDGPVNVRDAVRVAASTQARALGALVVFDGEIHAARWATKVHTCALHAFDSPGHGRLGYVDGDRVVVDVRPKRHEPMAVSNIHPAVDLIRLAMGADARFIDCALAAGTEGIVLEAFGRGNATEAVLGGVGRAVAAGVPVMLVSRCGQGRVQPVYGISGGAGLARAGALFAGDMPGSKARVLLAALLAQGLDGPALQAEVMRLCDY